MARLASLIALLCTLLPLALLPIGRARPDGAVGCPADRSAPGDEHRGEGFTEGTIADGLFNVTIDGVTLSVDTPLNLSTGSTHDVTVSTSAFFRGILARIGGGDANVSTTTVFTVADDDPDLQISDDCLQLGVGGVTHTNRNDKTTVTFSMMLDEPSTAMSLDVNIVQSNPSPSIFYYSQYVINAVDPSPPSVPTSIPTTVPRDTPSPTITFAPTDRPTMSEMPTAAPTGLGDLFGIISRADLGVATLVVIAELETGLSDESQNFTLLAPSNAAIEELPDRIVEYWLENRLTVLPNLLLGHVFRGRATRENILTLNGTEVRFVNQVTQTVNVSTVGDISVSVGGGDFDGFARFVQTDLFASNGVIHVIDRFIGIPTILELVLQGGGTLATAFEISGLVDELSGWNGVTLFAPTSSAFLALDSEANARLVDAVLSDERWNVHARALLLAHVAPSVYFSVDLANEMTVNTWDGDAFTVSRVNETVTVAHGSAIGVATVLDEVVTTQGVVHTIDAVLIPGILTRTVFEVAMSETSTLATLVVAADFVDQLRSTFGVTMFAPNNEAFAKIGQATVDFLQTEGGRSTLISILRYHILEEGLVIPSVQVSKTRVGTLFGLTIGIEISEENGIILNGQATVVRADILANNGIVHTINEILDIPTSEPPTNSPTTNPTGLGAERPLVSTASPVERDGGDPSSAHRVLGVSAILAGLITWPFL